MRIKHLILPMFMTVMGMAFTSCTDDDMTCKDCNKEMAVTIDVVDVNGMPMSQSRGVGYTTWGAGTYDTAESPSVGARAEAGYKIIKFDKWTEKNGLEVLVKNASVGKVEDSAKGELGNHSYTVTVEAEKKFTNTVKAGTGGTASGTYTGITDASHSISASPNSGYKFKNWTWSGTGVKVTDPNSASTTATIGSSDGTITANFESTGPKMYTVSISETLDGVPSLQAGGPYASDNLGIITPSTSDWSRSVKEGTNLSVYAGSGIRKLTGLYVNGVSQSINLAGVAEWSGPVNSNISISIQYTQKGY